MGIFSNSSTDTGALEEFYSRAIGKFVATKTGGVSYALQKNDVTSIAAFGGAVSGGYSALEDYGNSVYSSAKEKLIRGIAKDVSSMLKVTASYAETADIQEVVAKLQRIVPNPKNHKSIKADSAMHKDLCMALAKSINKQYDMNIIDADAEPSTICNKVSEIMYSLFTGLHSEFLTISGDVSRILSNLQVLQEYVDSANKKLIQNLENSNGGEDGETESIKALYNKLSEEIDRQHAILANLTNSVIGPVGESLITILEDNDDFAQLTTDLKKMTGATEFGNKLSYLLSGTSGIASAAAIVDKALKKIGMSVAEYKSVHGLRELREKIYNSMVKQKPTSGELHKLLVAAELLYKNDLAHDDIVAYLEKKKGGISGGADAYKSNSYFGDSFADAADIDTLTNNAENPFAGRPQAAKKSIIKQISEKQQLRKQLFLTLNQKIKADYDKIKLSLSHIARKIGGEIELCPELDVFVRQLNNFAESQPDRQNIHIALSGYRTDLESTFVKYQFMENLYAISESAEALLACKGGHAFKDIKSSVDSLTHAVEEFNATFLNTLTDVSVHSLGVGAKTIKSARGGVQIDKYAETLSGGHNGKHTDGSDCEGGDDHTQQEDPEEQEDAIFEGNTKDAESQIFHKLGGVIEGISHSEFNHFRTMQSSIREIDYFYRIADIKRNMQVTAGEYENNTENYENILGEEAGFTIDQIQKKYNDLLNALESDTTPQGVTNDVTKLYKGDRGYATLPDDIDDYAIADAAIASIKRIDTRLYTELNPLKTTHKQTVEDYEGGYKFLLEYIRSSKVEMLEAAQALDLYLSKFTQSMQFKPDQIKEFVQVLEQLEIVAKWFTDKSGDHMVGVFEAFSSAPTVNFPYNTIDTFDNLRTTNAGDNTIDNKLDDQYKIDTHYYDHITTKSIDKTNPSVGKFYQPRMMTRIQAVNFVKQIEKSIKSVRALENIIATFSRVNTSVSSDVKTFMSSGLMFKAFMKYCTASVISIGYLALDANKNISSAVAAGGNLFITSDLKSIHAKMAVGLRFNNDAIKWTGNVVQIVNKIPINTYLELCDPLSIYTTKTENSLARNNDICDNIYEMAIKSMIAKVFTVVGSYTLFNKPAKDQSNSFSMSTNPLRQILGGSVGGVERASIIPAATELYVRLPLLVEWYRGVFDFKSQTPNAATNPLISMIPDMDSVFGPLCKVIFLDAVNVNDGAYPAEYAHRIIDAITNIYKFHIAKKASTTTREILNEFVLEINRRYGFIMREEVNAYLGERSAYIQDSESYSGDERVDYDLLDVDAGMGKRPAPSDKFRAFTKTKSVRKYDAMDLLKAAKRFRQSVEDNLQLASPKDLGLNDVLKDSDFANTIANISLTGIVAETKRKIEELPTDNDKYMVVHEQLHGIEKFGDIDQQKIILFHETVITPLTVLYFTYLILNDYNKFCTSLNPGDPGDDNALPNEFNAAALLNKNIQLFKGDGIYKTLNKQNLTDDTPPAFKANNQINSESLFNKKEYTNLIGADVFLTRQNLFKDKILELLLRKLMNVGSDMNGLTEIYFAGSTSSNTYPVLNYDKLEEMCTELLSNAKSALHQLRKFVPSYLVKKYEDISSGTEENRISLFYIQEQLFDRLFKNKYGNGLTDANNGAKNIYLTMTKNYDGKPNPSRSFSTVFSKLAFWDINKTIDPYKLKDNNVLDAALSITSGNTDLQEIKLDNSSNTGFPLAYNPILNSGSTLSNLTQEDSKIIFSAVVPVRLNDQPNSDIILPGKISKINKDDVILCAYYAADVADAPAPAQLGSKMFVGTKNLYDMDDNKYSERNTELGLIPKLNTIIHKFCNIFIDKSSGKIYKTLIEKFVNGHNAKDILNGKNINDNICEAVGVDIVESPTNVKANTVFKSAVCRTEPQPNAVLFASIANGLRGLALGKSEKLTGGSLAFVEDNFLNISEYQKELMRANLPAFEKELNLVVKRADFMKKCLEETHVQTVAMAPADNVKLKEANLLNNIETKATQKNKQPDDVQADALYETNDVRKSYLIGIYDDILLTAKSLIRCIVDTQKELNDVPMYFETYSESLIDYNSRNGHLPFMPVSNITHLFNFNSFVPENEAANENASNFTLSVIPRPSMGAGSPEFKFTYGTRGLLHYKQPASLQYAPGVQELLESYNAKLGGAASFDKTKLEHITKGVITISRWCIDYMYHNQVLDCCNWSEMRNLVKNNQNCVPVGKFTGIKDGLVQNLTCQTAKNTVVGPNIAAVEYSFWGKTANIVLLAESDNFGQSVYRFMKGMSNDAKNKLSGAERKDYCIFNILDLNIVPINIHAMQREIPFINLFNYAYTFDHMVKNFIGVRTKVLPLKEIGGEIPVYPTLGAAAVGENEDAYILDQYQKDILSAAPEDTLVRQVIYPLGLRRLREYVTHTYRLMSGTTSLGLNRPKYLSDQLWNKVLLNSIYDTEAELKTQPKYSSVNVAQAIDDTNEPFAVGYSVAQVVSQSLTYLSNSTINVKIPFSNNLITIGGEGFIRYQSKLVRWNEWFVQLQRIVRLLMRSQLEWVQDPVVQGSDAISAEVTEYKRNNVFSVGDYE